MAGVYFYLRILTRRKRNFFVSVLILFSYDSPWKIKSNIVLSNSNEISLFHLHEQHFDTRFKIVFYCAVCERVSLFAIFLTDKNPFAYLAIHTVLLNKQFIYVNRSDAQHATLSLVRVCVEAFICLIRKTSLLFVVPTPRSYKNEWSLCEFNQFDNSDFIFLYNLTASLFLRFIRRRRCLEFNYLHCVVCECSKVFV